MTSAVQSMLTSTIASRLAILLVFPAIGTLVLGSLVAVEERNSMEAAQELRREAELVELLASLTIAIEMEADSIVGLQEAALFGVDVTALQGVFDQGTIDADQHGVDSLFDAVADKEPDQWADQVAVEELLAARMGFVAYRSRLESESRGFAAVRARVTDPAERALEAQIKQLDRRFGQLELGSDLSAVAHSVEPARRVLAAAQDERQALAQYLLPLGAEGTPEERYRELIAANARYTFTMAELEASLPIRHRAELEAIMASPEWIVYDNLRDQALDGTVTPAVDVSEPMRLLPTGVVTFLNGFERVRMLSVLERQLSAEFAAGAEELEADANRRLLRIMVAGLGLAVLTGTVSVLTIRSINRPLQSLLERARQITDGSLDTERPPGGPSDINMVHAALDEMTANLQTVTDQAEALSAGRLDDEVFDRQVVGSLGSSVHGSVARLRSMTARLEHEATHDSLTGLPNRAAVIAFLERSLTGPVDNRESLAVVMLDLDGFKQANDNMGHLVGDEVLCQVANRLRNRAGAHFVARLGGDEFMIILAGPDAAELVMPVATTAVSAISEPMSLSCGLFDVLASAGVVETGFGEWLTPSEVLRRADLAMYEAKADSPGEVVRFDQRLHDSLLATTQLSGELHQALGRDEFRLHLQPIVETGTGRTSGYEALIRWDSPTRGAVSPTLFIGVAEQSELITHIDTWVIRRSAEILAGWQADPTMAHLTLSINVSARHLSRPDLPTEIAAGIDLYGLPADRYVIEITESQLIPNLARAEDNLRRLKEIGVRLAIDDFGTGYASVAHLRRVAFDRLKIDQSFLAHLSDATDRSLASLLVSLGRDLELEVVAEGIETPVQMQWATEAGCTHAQGYWLGRPQPAETVRHVDDVASPLRVDEHAGVEDPVGIERSLHRA